MCIVSNVLQHTADLPGKNQTVAKIMGYYRGDYFYRNFFILLQWVPSTLTPVTSLPHCGQSNKKSVPKINSITKQIKLKIQQ